MTKEELHGLRNEDLLNLARNPSAHQRKAAIRLLVERGSHLASHPDIVNEASTLVHSDPMVLAKSDPASVKTAHKLPGLLDVVAVGAKRVSELESRSSSLEAGLRGMDRERLLSDVVQKMDEHLTEIKREFRAIDCRLQRLERPWWQKVWDWFRTL